MINLGFYNHASTQTTATKESVKNIRSIYPDAPIFISLDGNSSLVYGIPYLRNIYNCEFAVNKEKLSYPPYDKQRVLEWLRRMYVGVLAMDCTHFMMVEDDCVLFNKLNIEDDWECVGHTIHHGNKIPPFILTEIERISGIKANVDYYGNGGGSIFKRKTFLNNFHKIYDYFNAWWCLYSIEFSPASGYMDCYMTLFYLLCGKQYTPNLRMKNIDPHNPEENYFSRTASYEEVKERYSQEFDLVHNWKGYYDR